MPATVIWQPISRWCLPAGSAPIHAKLPSGFWKSFTFLRSSSPRLKSPDPGSSTFGLRLPSLPQLTSRSWMRQPSTDAQRGEPASRSMSNSSRLTQPDLCMWVTGAERRSVMLSPSCCNGPVTPSLVSSTSTMLEFRSTNWPRVCGPGSEKRSGIQRRFPRVAITANTCGRTPGRSWSRGKGFRRAAGIRRYPSSPLAHRAYAAGGARPRSGRIRSPL